MCVCVLCCVCVCGWVRWSVALLCTVLNAEWISFRSFDTDFSSFFRFASLPVTFYKFVSVRTDISRLISHRFHISLAIAQLHFRLCSRFVESWTVCVRLTPQAIEWTDFWAAFYLFPEFLVLINSRRCVKCLVKCLMLADTFQPFPFVWFLYSNIMRPDSVRLSDTSFSRSTIVVA